MGRGTEERERKRRKKTKGNQRKRGDITVDGNGYSLKMAVSQHTLHVVHVIHFVYYLEINVKHLKQKKYCSR